jgi:hypothetical protein
LEIPDQDLKALSFLTEQNRQVKPISAQTKQLPLKDFLLPNVVEKSAATN